MRLIDADALEDEMMKADMPPHDIGGRYQTGFMDARSMAIAAPTIDPVKHGRWIPGREIAREMIGDIITAIIYEDWKCSNCGCTVEDEKPSWKYCPNCGAKMDGGKG